MADKPVGGGPGSGELIGPIPQAIEVLLRKASVDAEFRALLLEKRSAAAQEIGLRLDPAQAAVLDGTPRDQLEATIARTKVKPEHRAAFARSSSVLELALLTAVAGLVVIAGTASLGHTADLPDNMVVDPASRPTSVEPEPVAPQDPEEKGEDAEQSAAQEEQPPPHNYISKGIRPDRPSPREE